MGQAVTNIRGIGAHAAALLSEHGFNSVEDIAKATPEAVMAVRGFGSVRAKQLVAAAAALLKAPAKNPTKAEDPAPAGERETKSEPAADAAEEKEAKGGKKAKKDKAEKKKKGKKGKKKDKKGSGKKGKKKKGKK